ncbi:MAG: protein kinase [Candidatus Eisenbacteria bacterium]|nr:protein kinase [Candidatus Eisenbacteria bacterium]
MKPISPSDIFNRALQRPREERAAFVERECAGNEALRLKILKLLESAERHPELIEDPREEAPIPDRIGRYQILRRIGGGGMGDVYLARDPSLDREIAIKIITPRAARHVSHGRFEREARILASLNHPNIATIHSLEESRGVTFLTMEHVQGESLASRLARGRLGVTATLRIGLQIALALEAAHARAIIHRDLKPENVMVSPGEHVKVLDFGIAKSIGPAAGSDRPGSPGDESKSSDSSGLLGTLDYMSPEQSSLAPVGRQTDIWGLGCILYECLTGCRAFRRNPQDPREILERPDWKRIPPHTPQRVRKLIRSSLSDSPQHRPADASAVRKTLDDALKPRRRIGAVLIPLLLAALVLAFVYREGLIESPAGGSSGPASVRTLPKGGLEVALTDGSTTILNAPRGHPAVFRDAELLGLDPSVMSIPEADEGPEPLIIAWTEMPDLLTRNHLYGWDHDLELQFTIPAVDDFPGLGTVASGNPVDCQMRMVVIDAIPEQHRCRELLVVDISQYYPSALRLLELAAAADGIAVEEALRLYHEGNIHNAALSPGLSADKQLLWLTGSVVTRRPPAESAGGFPGSTFFTCCMETARGTFYFPPYLEPDSAFAAAHPEGARPAEVLFYFIVRGYLDEGETFDWSNSGGLLIQSVAPIPSETGRRYHLQLTTSKSLHAEFMNRDTLSVWFGATGGTHRILAERARAFDAPVDSLKRAFLADSVFFLAYSHPDLHVAGEFRDLRSIVGR